MTPEIILNIIQIVAIAGTAIVLVNKNNILSIRSEQQGKMLTELQQSLVGHAKVLDSALRYSEAFDIDKVRKVIELELTGKFEVEKKELEEQFKMAAQPMSASEEKRLKAFSDILVGYVTILSLLDDPAVEEALKQVADTDFKKIIRKTVVHMKQSGKVPVLRPPTVSD